MNRRALRLQLKIGALAGSVGFLFLGVPWGIYYGGSFGLLSAVSVMGSPLPEHTAVTLFVIACMLLGLAVACLFWLALGSLVSLAVGAALRFLVNRSLRRLDSRASLDPGEPSGPGPLLVGLRTVQQFFASEKPGEGANPDELMKGETRDLA